MSQETATETTDLAKCDGLQSEIVMMTILMMLTMTMVMGCGDGEDACYVDVGHD